MLAILKHPDIEIAINNATSTEKKLTDYQCINFLKWEYPFMTLWWNWLPKLPKDIPTVLGKEWVIWIDPNEKLIEKVLFHDDKTRRIIKEYWVLYTEVTEKLDELTRHTLNAPIDNIPIITDWKTFFTNYFMYIHLNKALVQISDKVHKLPLIHQKTIFDLKLLMQKAYSRNDNNTISQLEQRLNRIYDKTSEDTIDIIYPLHEIHRTYKQIHFHSKSMTYLFGKNQYYDIEKYTHKETWEVLLEEIIPLPEWEIGDMSWFITHSWFDNKRDNMVHLLHLIEGLHKKEEEILEILNWL